MAISAFNELFYNGLFHPVTAYREIAKEETPSNQILFLALLFIVLVSGTAPVVDAIWKSAGEFSSLGVLIPLKAVGGFAVWLIMGSVISTLAYAYTGQSRFKTFLVLSALSCLPWVLMGPLALLKVGFGELGSMLGFAGGLGIWLWSVFLFALSIGVTYELPLERVFIVLVMPFVFTLIALGWIFGFFINLGNILS